MKSEKVSLIFISEEKKALARMKDMTFPVISLALFGEDTAQE